MLDVETSIIVSHLMMTIFKFIYINTIMKNKKMLGKYSVVLEIFNKRAEQLTVHSFVQLTKLIEQSREGASTN